MRSWVSIVLSPRGIPRATVKAKAKGMAAAVPPMVLLFAFTMDGFGLAAAASVSKRRRTQERRRPIDDMVLRAVDEQSRSISSHRQLVFD